LDSTSTSTWPRRGSHDRSARLPFEKKKKKKKKMKTKTKRRANAFSVTHTSTRKACSSFETPEGELSEATKPLRFPPQQESERCQESPSQQISKHKRSGKTDTPTTPFKSG
jgi:hypothetical protein